MKGVILMSPKASKAQQQKPNRKKNEKHKEKKKKEMQSAKKYTTVTRTTRSFKETITEICRIPRITYFKESTKNHHRNITLPNYKKEDFE